MSDVVMDIEDQLGLFEEFAQDGYHDMLAELLSRRKELTGHAAKRVMEQGLEQYGDGAFRKSMIELLGEGWDELADAIFYFAVRRAVQSEAF